MHERLHYEYILASRSKNIYTGMTNRLISRVQAHREGKLQAFTACHRIHRLVYYQVFHDALTAIDREKESKGWSPAKRVALIEK